MNMPTRTPIMVVNAKPFSIPAHMLRIGSMAAIIVLAAMKIM